MSFSLGGEATLADIAGLLEDVTPGRHGMPLLIDIAWLEVGLATPARDRASPDQPGLAA
jgi:hypothetical protein